MSICLCLPWRGQQSTDPLDGNQCKNLRYLKKNYFIILKLLYIDTLIFDIHKSFVEKSIFRFLHKIVRYRMYQKVWYNISLKKFCIVLIKNNNTTRYYE